MSGACGSYGREQRCIQGVCRRPEGKTPLGRPLRRKLEDNIKMNLQEFGWGVMDWIDLAQNGCKCGKEPSSSIECGNFMTSRGHVSFSGRTLLRGDMEIKIRIFSTTS